MNIQPMKMDPRIARIHYSDFLKSVRKNRIERESRRLARAKEIHKELYKVRVEKTQLELEDEMLLQAYRQLSKGEQILDIHHTITKAGLNAQQLPNLAIAQADKAQCWITTVGPNKLRFKTSRFWNLKKSDYVDVTLNVEDMYNRLNNSHWRNTNNHTRVDAVKALIPTVPPQYRPSDLSNYYILWEAHWEACAPIDPVLLRRINDRFYTVVAQWDLTPLERSVLEGRL